LIEKEKWIFNVTIGIHAFLSEELEIAARLQKIEE
jgi:hypothetical protein